jgi:hypothetical protein
MDRMTREHETSVLALLLVLAAGLYAVTWSIAGRSAYLEAPAAVLAVEHAPSAESATRLASSVPASR